MLNQMIYIIFAFFVYLLLAVPIVLLAFFIAKKLPIKQKIFAGFIVYGLVSGFVSSYWWTVSDMPWLSNLPGEFLGDRFHSNRLWIVDLPFIFIPSSLMFWGFSGLVFQQIYDKVR